MRSVRLRIIIIYVLLAILCLNPLKVRAEDESERQYRILFISSYEYSNASVPDQLEGFEEGLEGINVDISYEFMDANRYYSSADINNFDRYLRHKVFLARDYDLVAVADDPALRYAINNRDALFPDVPLVFMGINSTTEAATAFAMKNTTGIPETPDFEGNYELMRRLFPKRRRINVVVDSSIAGQGDYVQFMKFRETHPDISSIIINTSYYTAGGLKDLLGSLGENDIILFLDFTIDGDKNNYSIKNGAEFLTENAPDIPIFRLASSDIEHGVFGGISYSYEDAGRIIGDAAKRILLGEDADSMTLTTSSVTTAFFEQGRMDSFGIKYSQLPAGAVVLNEHDNLARFYRNNKVISNLAIVIIILMIFIIVMLYIANSHRKKAVRTDFLTQMPNRKKLIEDMNQVINLSFPYGIIMLDVDHFKNINDTYGHKVGDEIITGVGDRLKKFRKEDITFARLGGDEFCGLFLAPSDEKARKICKQIIEGSKKSFKTSAGDIKLTVSIGCAMFPVDTDDRHIVMECADRALYVTKENGRNGYTLFGGVDKT